MALSAYTISYYMKGSRAWMPYFSDVSSAGDDVWVDGEGLVRKKRSMDTIAYFLETGHEGYCMHFASAGVLILQELGIPARYASGYIVKMDAFHLNGGQYEADIYDRNGHAWAEIYLEGIGWVPFEMTPGYSVTSDSLPTDASGQEALQEKHTQKTQEESQAEEDSQTESPSEADNSGESESEESQAETSQAEEPQDEMPGTQIVSGTGTEDGEYQADIGTKSSVNWAKVCRIMGILLAAAALFGLIWTIIRRKMRQYREVLLKEMRHQRYRPAVRRINRRIYRRL